MSRLKLVPYRDLARVAEAASFHWAQRQGSHSTCMQLSDVIRDDAIPFSVDSPETRDLVVDHLIASLGASVQLLGFGEALL